MWLLQRIDIGQISVSIYLLSFFGVVFSAATLGERVGIVQMVGAIVVITATVLSDSHERNARRSVT
jgi:drug/metabolite transporter (DMT)-like permease